ncbi:hypothetical protein [Aequorivita sp. KMM 9714]|uniref:hypothetical protein n=1 Tax=Aequorivita sp. KMM 9714 TaxID=2707173 RepID=UPI0013EE2B66|nr:hypothetical protein [Aequorivita sp. KMM 9714]NGX83837.1 hypothetical protein [Aequorivita sp. KMM 9714]
MFVNNILNTFKVLLTKYLSNYEEKYSHWVLHRLACAYDECPGYSAFDFDDRPRYDEDRSPEKIQLLHTGFVGKV